MNREEFIRVARQVSTWEKGTIPFRAAFDQLIAEFDRLNEIIKNQSTIINSCGERGATLQVQLDRISAPIKGTQRSSTRGGRGCSDSDREAVDRICAYLDSQKPSEKPKEEHGCLGFCYVNGRCIPQKDCPICNPKCEHKNLEPLALGGTQRCPECHGTKYINRVVAVAEWEQHPIYVIATCLNCNPSGACSIKMEDTGGTLRP